jgi:hypothetical protein
MRYFRLHSTLEIAERRTRVGRMNSVYKPAMVRSVARRLGARLRPRLRISSWCRTSTESATTEPSPPGLANQPG